MKDAIMKAFLWFVFLISLTFLLSLSNKLLSILLVIMYICALSYCGLQHAKAHKRFS